MINEKSFNEICTIIKNNSGICINGAHEDFLNKYVKKRLSELNIDIEKYILLINSNKNELLELINEVAINETYFFREEKQFKFLFENVLPQYENKRCLIWSAACSTGEEPISLYVLAKEAHVNVDLLASDIDTQALDIFNKGSYGKVSYRKDGSSFHHLLNKYVESENKEIITYSKKLLNSINRQKINLINPENNINVPVDGSVSIIYLRNVLIYFDKEQRNKIISFMEKKLEDSGFLFCSMSEIASIEIPKDSNLVKEKDGNVYFFKKRNKKDIKVNEKISKNKTTSIVKNILITNKKEEKKKTIIDKSSQNQKNSQIKKIIRKTEIVKPEDFYLTFCKYLNEKQYVQAEEYLNSAKFQLDKKYLVYYFKGIYYQAIEKPIDALKNFEKAILLSPSFWLAEIKCGIIKKNNKQKDAKKHFTKAALILEKYVGKNNCDFDYLLESFSTEYFYNLCTKYLQKEIEIDYR